ncbi:MAG TPA: SdpI family protein [Longimicrobiales bacterium]
MTRRWLGPVMIVGMLVFSAVVYPSLPERVATHWNVRGEVDGWSAPWSAAVFAPGIALALWLLLPLLRRIDPRRRNYDRFEPTFWVLVNAIVLFMGAIHVATLGAALGWPFDITRTMLVLIGLTFVVLGNYMPRLRSNWWLGVRTPWTLESEAVWRGTHRVAGYTFVLGGLLAMAAALLPSPLAFVVAFTGMTAGALIPVVYSYVLFRRERRDAGTA